VFISVGKQEVEAGTITVHGEEKNTLKMSRLKRKENIVPSKFYNFSMIPPSPMVFRHIPQKPVMYDTVAKHHFRAMLDHTRLLQLTLRDNGFRTVLRRMFCTVHIKQT